MVMSMQQQVRSDILNLLRSTRRQGVPSLMDALEDGGFYKDPASVRWHGAYEGGLACHSWLVARLLLEHNASLGLGLSFDTCVITGICHDLCKMGRYKVFGSGYQYDYGNPAGGHGIVSVRITEKYVQLSDQERQMIAYHMGPWQTPEATSRDEYSLATMLDAWNDRAVRLIYFCDEMATMKEVNDA